MTSYHDSSRYSIQNTDAGARDFSTLERDITTRDNLFGTFVGQNTGKNNSGERNSALGYEALQVSLGSANTALGYSAGMQNLAGTYNVFLGASAGLNNTQGKCNIFLGHQSGFLNTAGGDNILIGARSSYGSEYQNRNIVVGNRSLASNQARVGNCVVIGHDIDVGLDLQGRNDLVQIGNPRLQKEAKLLDAFQTSPDETRILSDTYCNLATDASFAADTVRFKNITVEQQVSSTSINFEQDLSVRRDLTVSGDAIIAGTTHFEGPINIPHPHTFDHDVTFAKGKVTFKEPPILTSNPVWPEQGLYVDVPAHFSELLTSAQFEVPAAGTFISRADVSHLCNLTSTDKITVQTQLALPSSATLCNAGITYLAGCNLLSGPLHIGKELYVEPEACIYLDSNTELRASKEARVFFESELVATGHTELRGPVHITQGPFDIPAEALNTTGLLTLERLRVEQDASLPGDTHIRGEIRADQAAFEGTTRTHKLVTCNLVLPEYYTYDKPIRFEGSNTEFLGSTVVRGPLTLSGQTEVDLQPLVCKAGLRVTDQDARFETPTQFDASATFTQPLHATAPVHLAKTVTLEGETHFASNPNFPDDKLVLPRLEVDQLQVRKGAQIAFDTWYLSNQINLAHTNVQKLSTSNATIKQLHITSNLTLDPSVNLELPPLVQIEELEVNKDLEVGTQIIAPDIKTSNLRASNAYFDRVSISNLIPPSQVDFDSLDAQDAYMSNLTTCNSTVTGYLVSPCNIVNESHASNLMVTDKATIDIISASQIDCTGLDATRVGTGTLDASYIDCSNQIQTRELVIDRILRMGSNATADFGNSARFSLLDGSFGIVDNDMSIGRTLFVQNRYVLSSASTSSSTKLALFSNIEQDWGNPLHFTCDPLNFGVKINQSGLYEIEGSALEGSEGKKISLVTSNHGTLARKKVYGDVRFVRYLEAADFIWMEAEDQSQPLDQVMIWLRQAINPQDPFSPIRL